MPRLAIVSDSHLSVANPDGDRNWQAVLDHLAVTAPDLVIHAGDISADGNDDVADLEYARAQLDRIPAPWLAVPGNHDLGGPECDPGLITRRHTRYEQVFGQRFWTAGARSLASGRPRLRDLDLRPGRRRTVVGLDRRQPAG